MVDIHRVRTVWRGLAGGTGVSTMYFDAEVEAAPPTAAIRTFWDSLKTLVPDAVTFQVQGAGDTIDAATGVLTAGWSTSTPATVTGTGGSLHSAPTGGLIHWETGTVIAGRRLRGSTFIVPLVNLNYDGSGTLTSGCIGTLGSAAGVLIGATGADMVVWHRPEKGGSDGGVAVVTTASVPDKAMVLRSRRD